MYHRLVKPVPKNAPLARDTVYGLSASAMLVLMSIVAKEMISTHFASPLLARLKEDLRSHILDELERQSAGGTKPVERFTAITAPMRGSCLSGSYISVECTTLLRNTSQDEKARIEADLTDYLTELDAQYGQLRPSEIARYH
jgi:hypothetical protein